MKCELCGAGLSADASGFDHKPGCPEAFRARLAASMERNRAILDRLAESEREDES